MRAMLVLVGIPLLSWAIPLSRLEGSLQKFRFMEAAPYTKQGVRCEAGKELSKEKCQAAAKSQGYPFMEGQGGNERPLGCFEFQNEGKPAVAFNTATETKWPTNTPKAFQYCVPTEAAPAPAPAPKKTEEEVKAEAEEKKRQKEQEEAAIAKAAAAANVEKTPVDSKSFLNFFKSLRGSQNLEGTLENQVRQLEQSLGVHPENNMTIVVAPGGAPGAPGAPGATSNATNPAAAAAAAAVGTAGSPLEQQIADGQYNAAQGKVVQPGQVTSQYFALAPQVADSTMTGLKSLHKKLTGDAPFGAVTAMQGTPEYWAQVRAAEVAAQQGDKHASEALSNLAKQLGPKPDQKEVQRKQLSQAIQKVASRVPNIKPLNRNAPVYKEQGQQINLEHVEMAPPPVAAPPAPAPGVIDPTKLTVVPKLVQGFPQ